MALAGRSVCGRDAKPDRLDLPELLARLIKLAPEGVHHHDLGCTIECDSRDAAGHLRPGKLKFTCRICDGYADKLRTRRWPLIQDEKQLLEDVEIAKRNLAAAARRVRPSNPSWTCWLVGWLVMGRSKWVC